MEPFLGGGGARPGRLLHRGIWGRLARDPGAQRALLRDPGAGRTHAPRSWLRLRLRALQRLVHSAVCIPVCNEE